MRDYAKWASNRNPVLELVFPTSIGRISYMLRTVLLNAFVGIPLMDAVTPGPQEAVALSTLGCVLAASIAATIFWLWNAVRPRIRDLGWSPHIGWLAFVPVVHLGLAVVLTFVPGRPPRL